MLLIQWQSLSAFILVNRVTLFLYMKSEYHCVTVKVSWDTLILIFYSYIIYSLFLPTNIYIFRSILQITMKSKKKKDKRNVQFFDIMSMILSPLWVKRIYYIYQRTPDTESYGKCAWKGCKEDPRPEKRTGLLRYEKYWFVVKKPLTYWSRIKVYRDKNFWLFNTDKYDYYCNNNLILCKQKMTTNLHVNMIFYISNHLTFFFPSERKRRNSTDGRIRINRLYFSRAWSPHVYRPF